MMMTFAPSQSAVRRHMVSYEHVILRRTKYRLRTGLARLTRLKKDAADFDLTRSKGPVAAKAATMVLEIDRK